MKKIRVICKIIISTLAISAAAFGIYSLMTSATFRIRKINIQFAGPMSAAINTKKIEQSLRVRLHPLIGQYTWQINLENVLAQVEKDRLVKSAKVRRILPNRLNIFIVPNVPIANVMGAHPNKLFPLARDGELMPPLGLADAFDGPILRGVKFLIHSKLREKAIGLLLALPKQGWLSRRNISEVDFNKTRGFAMTLSPSGTDVWLGFKNFSEHALHAERVFDYLVDKHLTGRIIDARLDKKVVVKLRNAP